MIPSETSSPGWIRSSSNIVSLSWVQAVAQLTQGEVVAIDGKSGAPLP